MQPGLLIAADHSATAGWKPLMRMCVRIKHCIQARLVWKHINYPIYIPEADPQVGALLVKGDIEQLIADLRRRTALGSMSAAALLGFLELMGGVSGKLDPQAAITCCSAAAKAGDPYAQYVIAWAYWEIGNRDDALSWMKLPAAAGFLPALVDTGRMLALVAHNEGELRTAVGILWGAHKLGHVVPLVAISGIAVRGQLGLMQRFLGLVMLPYAAIRMLLGYRCMPFGIRSFCIARRQNVAFFR